MNTPFLVRIRWLATVLVCSTAASGAEPESLQSVEKAATEWVKTRAETVRLQTQWAEERALLVSMVEALQERADALDDRHEQVAAKTAQERGELAELRQKRGIAADELAGMEQRLKALSANLLGLRPKLPPRLADALELTFRSLADGELSPGQRMQLAMTVLNRCSQFNAAVSSGEEVLTLPGQPARKSLDVIYWGLSHGYALDRQTGQAWIGSPGEERWEWTPSPGAAEAVGKLIAIHHDRADPEVVPVPARITGRPHL
ncbi:MAG TPA: DUF3450 family protein [Opitutus sp.]|nr:DUF3450 family protein [Opitutus sp.]